MFIDLKCLAFVNIYPKGMYDVMMDLLLFILGKTITVWCIRILVRPGLVSGFVGPLLVASATKRLQIFVLTLYVFFSLSPFFNKKY